ncbi:hypothetical protein HPB51_021179 [Rhipicephalus microplus]|uniref:Uncharacterized protein n=1 Tax=Rhipicephalus microplus TaxID=6941 RepID=A0A9J6F7I5_RHIMP|nr:hypothetical protein HPB51_021179 [Rhipicephalus microplus]
MASPNQVTGYDPESLQIIQMDTAQTETPLPTEEEYLKDMVRVWRGRKNTAVASRDARAPAAKQQAASRPQQAQGKNAPSVASQRAKQLRWRPKNTPRIEEDDIIVVLKPRETLDLKATFGPGQAGAAVRSILGADASVGLAVWPLWDQNVLVCTLKSVDAAERLLRDIKLPVGGRQLTFRGHPKLSGEFCRGVVHVKKAPAAKSNKPELEKTDTGHSTNVKPGTPSEPPVLVKDFPPLTPVHAQVSCWGGAVSGPSSSPSPTETALQQQIGELRRQNQILARKIQELEAKQVGSSEPVQEAEAEDGDDGSSVTSRLTSVSRQDADTVVGPASIIGSIGRIESLEHKTEQLEASVAALPTQIMSAVRESFQDMFKAALTQELPEILAQVSNSVLKAVHPWVIAQIKNTTQSDSPQVKRKPASRQAAEEGFSGPAPAGGLRGRDALRLAHAFVTSRILYAVPYLRPNKQEDERIDAIIRKATKRALDLPVATSNAKLRALGVLNSYQELREAHLMNQYTRLAQTAPGRRLLNRLHIQHTCTAEEAERIPELWRHML